MLVAWLLTIMVYLICVVVMLFRVGNRTIELGTKMPKSCENVRKKLILMLTINGIIPIWNMYVGYKFVTAPLSIIDESINSTQEPKEEIV